MHSSNAIAISEPSAACVAIDISGDKNFSEPSICERKFTPSSVILRRSPKLNT